MFFRGIPLFFGLSEAEDGLPATGSRMPQLPVRLVQHPASRQWIHPDSICDWREGQSVCQQQPGRKVPL
jgi:hypothetical protein